MHGLAELVYGLGEFCMIAAFPEQGKVTGEGGGVAGDVDDTRRGDAANGLETVKV